MPLLRLFLDICLFRRGPRDTPASGFLLGLTVAANLLVSTLLGWLRLDFLPALGQSLAALGLLLVFLWLLLRLSRHPGRWLQTASAALACDGLVTLAALPLMALGLSLPEIEAYASLLLSALMLWAIAVLAHILRHALELPYLAGLALSLAYTLGSVRLMMALFPSLT